jgi:hypothetical protein
MGVNVSVGIGDGVGVGVGASVETGRSTTSVPAALFLPNLARASNSVVPKPTCTVTWKCPVLSVFAVARLTPVALLVTFTVVFGNVLPTMVTLPLASGDPVRLAGNGDVLTPTLFFNACTASVPVSDEVPRPELRAGTSSWATSTGRLLGRSRCPAPERSGRLSRPSTAGS